MTGDAECWDPVPSPGSFQTGLVIPTENPLHEAWSQLERLGTRERVAPAIARLAHPPEPHLDEYVRVRMRQAIELRNSAETATMLTRPLLLYYSFLNLLRATVSLGRGQRGKSSHGLLFVAGSSLLDASARLVNGTFREFLEYRSGGPVAEFTLKLSDCLASIVEIAGTFATVAGGRSRVAKVHVTAFLDAPGAKLDFELPGLSTADFRASWGALFPKLANVTTLSPNGATLHVPPGLVDDPRTADIFCRDYLLNDLRLLDVPEWYAIREDDGLPSIGRIAYYHIAMFILSNLVRYEPEQLLHVSRDGTELAWLIERFLRLAERFYPQLAIMMVSGQPVYFGANR